MSALNLCLHSGLDLGLGVDDVDPEVDLGFNIYSECVLEGVPDTQLHHLSPHTAHV